PFEPASRLSRQAGFNEVNRPVFPLAVVHLYSARSETHCQVARSSVVIEEIALDDVASVPEGDDELRKSEVAVVLHDVPQQRTSADLNHGLRPQFGFLA